MSLNKRHELIFSSYCLKGESANFEKLQIQSFNTFWLTADGEKTKEQTQYKSREHLLRCLDGVLHHLLANAVTAPVTKTPNGQPKILLTIQVYRTLCYTLGP